MLLDFAEVALREFGEVRGKRFVHGAECQDFEKITGRRALGIFGKDQPIVRAHDGENALGALLFEKVLEAHIEYHGDACQRGQRRDQPSVFELRQHRSGEAGVLAQIDERDFLAQPQLAELAAYVVVGENSADRLLTAFSVRQSRLIFTQIEVVCFSG